MEFHHRAKQAFTPGLAGNFCSVIRKAGASLLGEAFLEKASMDRPGCPADFM
jgi:hypothetical protein